MRTSVFYSKFKQNQIREENYRRLSPGHYSNRNHKSNSQPAIDHSKKTLHSLPLDSENLPRAQHNPNTLNKTGVNRQLVNARRPLLMRNGHSLYQSRKSSEKDNTRMKKMSAMRKPELFCMAWRTCSIVSIIRLHRILVSKDKKNLFSLIVCRYKRNAANGRT